MHALSFLSIVFHILLFSPLRFLLQISLTIFLPVTVIIRHVFRLSSIFVYLLFNVLSRLEAIYIFCGTAAILGMAMGTLLGLTAYVFAGALGLRDEGGVDGISCAASSTSSSSSHNISQKRRFSPTTTKSMLGQQQQLSISRMLISPPIPTILEEEDEDPPFLLGGYSGRRNGSNGGVDTLWIDGSGDSSGR